MRALFFRVPVNIVALVFLVLVQGWQPLSASEATLTGRAAELHRQAQGGRWFADAARLNPDIVPTSDGQSFVVVWKAAAKDPTHWIVSLHGSRGFATDDLAIWYPHLKDRAASPSTTLRRVRFSPEHSASTRCAIRAGSPSPARAIRIRTAMGSPE